MFLRKHFAATAFVSGVTTDATFPMILLGQELTSARRAPRRAEVSACGPQMRVRAERASGRSFTFAATPRSEVFWGKFRYDGDREWGDDGCDASRGPVD